MCFNTAVWNYTTTKAISDVTGMHENECSFGNKIIWMFICALLLVRRICVSVNPWWHCGWHCGRCYRTNERSLFANEQSVNSDRLPVKAEAHQSWPPKIQVHELELSTAVASSVFLHQHYEAARWHHQHCIINYFQKPPQNILILPYSRWLPSWLVPPSSTSESSDFMTLYKLDFNCNFLKNSTYLIK